MSPPHAQMRREKGSWNAHFYFRPLIRRLRRNRHGRRCSPARSGIPPRICGCWQEKKLRSNSPRAISLNLPVFVRSWEFDKLPGASIRCPPANAIPSTGNAIHHRDPLLAFHVDCPAFPNQASIPWLRCMSPCAAPAPTAALFLQNCKLCSAPPRFGRAKASPRLTFLTMTCKTVNFVAPPCSSPTPLHPAVELPCQKERVRPVFLSCTSPPLLHP